MCMGIFPVYISVPCVFSAQEGQRSHWLLAAIWVLWIEPRFFRTASTLKHRAICSVPKLMVLMPLLSIILNFIWWPNSLYLQTESNYQWVTWILMAKVTFAFLLANERESFENCVCDCNDIVIITIRSLLCYV